MEKCSQCGYIHPPIPGGGKCPMAIEQEEKADLRSRANERLANSYLSIKNDFLKKLESADDAQIEFLTSKVRNLINNFQL